MPDVPQSRLRWTGGALAFFIVGLLILIPSGLCTGIFGVVALFSDGTADDTASFLAEALIVGVPFIAIGAGMMWAGLRLRRIEAERNKKP